MKKVDLELLDILLKGERPVMVLYDVKDVAEILGVAGRTVRYWIDTKQLKAVRLGNKWKVEHDDLQEFIKSKENATSRRGTYTRGTPSTKPRKLQKTQKKRSDEGMQKQTWKDFLSGCDVSNWSWSSLDGLNIIGEDEEDDSYLVRLDLATVLDDPRLEYQEDDEATRVRWGGDWIEIENPQDVPTIYVKIYKKQEDGLFKCDGRFYFTEDEKKKE